MKKIFTILLATVVLNIFAQAPQKMSYQAVIWIFRINRPLFSAQYRPLILNYHFCV